MKIYAIQEYELKMISVFDRMFAFCCSVASGAFVLTLSTMWNMAASYENQTQKAGWAFVATCIVVMMIAVVFAVVFWKSKRSVLQDILKETKTTKQCFGNSCG